MKKLQCGAILAILALFLSGSARAEDNDDANARREWQKEWYGGEWTPAYRKFMHEAAARERAHWGHKLPNATDGKLINTDGMVTSAPATGTATAAVTAPVSGSTWINIGPTKADVLKNGSTSLVKTDAGRPVAIVPHPTDANTIYVAMAGGGVWKTTNALSNPATWTPLTESLGSLSCGFLAMDTVDSNTLYLGLGDAFDGTGIGFFKTADGGATWAGPVYLGDSTVINDIAVAQPPNNAVVMVATNKGLYRSTDSGANFSLVSLATGQTTPAYGWKFAWGGGSNWVMSLEANHDATTGTTDGQVWYTANDGATWTRSTGMTKTTGVGRISVASAPSSRTTMYAMAAIPNSAAATDLADLFRSTDGGHTWTALNATARKVAYTNRNTESTAPSSVLNGQGWYNHALIVNRTTPGTFYFGGALLLARATAATATPSYTEMTNWLAQFSLPYVHADFHAAAYDAAGNLWVGTDGGIFMSADSGTTWTDRFNVGITSHLAYSVGSSPASPGAVLGGLQDNGTRVRSGTTSTFNQELGGDGFGSHMHQSTPGTMIGTIYYDRIYKSTDGGNTFVSASSGILESNNSSTAPFNTVIKPWEGDATGNTVYTYTNLKVYKSVNYAGSWTALPVTGLPTTGNIRGVGIAKSNGSVIGTVWNGGKVYVSTNGGTSWTLAGTPPNNGLSMSYVSFDPVDAQIVYVASVAPDATKNHLWKSTDGGATFAAIDGTAAASNGFPFGVPVNSIVADPNASATLYAGTHLGVYRSVDGGATWARFGNALPLVNVTDFYISSDSTVMRAATFGRGFWELTP
ncbi:MAG: hypothetical protein ACJ79Y_03765 [Myxococcales bacterium]